MILLGIILLIIGVAIAILVATHPIHQIGVVVAIVGLVLILIGVVLYSDIDLGDGHDRGAVHSRSSWS